jgi:hypothetical protein
MLAKRIPALILFPVSTLLMGCNIYSHCGYGPGAALQLDAAALKPLELPANAASTSQRFRPVGVSAKSLRKGFDILLPSSTLVLAAAADAASRISCYQKSCEWAWTPVEPGYPVHRPDLARDWQWRG